MKKDNSALNQDREMSARGTELEKLYGGYFGSRENCQAFLPHIPLEMFKIKNPVIVDAGSSEGTLGVFVKEEFEKHGCNPHLVLIDANAAALEKSTAVAEKVVANLRNLSSIESKSVDLVLLRSVLQYALPDDQEIILRELWRILKPGGLLISQFGSFTTKVEADKFNGIFRSFGRLVFFCSMAQGFMLHDEIFSNIASVVGSGPVLYESMDDFSQRVNASPYEVSEAESYIEPYAQRYLGDILTSKQPPYAWKIPYTIASYKKR